MKIVVDPELCVGHALCMYAAPKVFKLNEHGCNAMGEFEVENGFEEEARSGVGACPEGAIRIIED